MKRIAILGMVAASLIQGPTPVEATPIWQITPMGGYTWSAKGTKGDEYAGGRLGVRLHPNLGLQVTAALSPTSEAPAGSGGVEFQHVVGDLTVTALQSSWGDAYVMAGGGYSRTTPDQSAVVTAGTFDQG